MVLVVSLLAGNQKAYSEKDPINGIEFKTQEVYTNWSATHSCSPHRVYEPTSPQQVLRLLQASYRLKDHKIPRLRPVGTCLSPNGIGMSHDSLLSTAALDLITVDVENQLVTVGGGARVSEVLKELSKHGLTLQNFSSIQEQQMAGWMQVAAHGTGCSLPTVEEMIVRMKLATPTEGLLTLSATVNPDLFAMAKVGLGSLGVVTELTLKCVPKHSLREHLYTTRTSEIGKGHYDRLRHYRHVRYMWLPYTPEAVVVVSNPVDPLQPDPVQEIINTWKETTAPKYSHLQPTYAFANLFRAIDKTIPIEELSQLSFSQYRERLLEYDPLNRYHIEAINRAEAEYWKLSTGSRVDDSTKILGFDCGGEQFVYEVCFPIGSLSEASNKDLEFMQKLLKLIEEHQLPTPCPIEQRWTARSTSKMSPAYSSDPNQVFCWVGIVLYIPKDRIINSSETASLSPEAIELRHQERRQQIEREFHKYMNLLQPLCEEYQAYPHWAKIELPRHVALTPVEEQRMKRKNAGVMGLLSSFFGSSSSGTAGLQGPLDSDEKLLTQLRKRLNQRYPIKEFQQYRRSLDPKGLLGNDLLDQLLQVVPSESEDKNHSKKQQKK